MTNPAKDPHSYHLPGMRQKSSQKGEKNHISPILLYRNETVKVEVHKEEKFHPCFQQALQRKQTNKQTNKHFSNSWICFPLILPFGVRYTLI